jgi:sulfite exporter TauE/SafE
MEILDIFLVSFMLGILGSFHCVGMCGPLVLGIFNQKFLTHPWHYLTYHLGKIIAYAIIGASIGLIGATFHIFISQQKISILTGVSLLLYVVWSKVAKKDSMSSKVQTYYSRFRTFFEGAPWPKYYLFGFLNGFLPCGLVYIAATSAISTGHVSMSILWMIFFGLGTIPSLSLVLLIRNRMASKYHFLFQKIYQNIIFFLAILLILRGLNLGIPYLSPSYDVETEQVFNCCHR